MNYLLRPFNFPWNKLSCDLDCEEMLYLQLRWSAVIPLGTSHFIFFNKSVGFLKSHFKNVCKELQVQLAGKGYPQIVGKFFIFLTYLKARYRKSSPHGKNCWQEDYLRLPYFCSFLSNIIYNLFMPDPSPTGVFLPCNLSFVICSLLCCRPCEWGATVCPAQRCGNIQRNGAL